MPEPERTPDGRYIIVDGRKWRATDPAIPETLRKELVSELMAARRAVGRAEDAESEEAARRRVNDAKVALGERGRPWWEERDPEAIRERLRAAILVLLRKRDPGSSICPSDAARVCGGESWRELMLMVRELAAELADEGVVEITAGARPVSAVASRGPIRIRRGGRFMDG